MNLFLIKLLLLFSIALIPLKDKLINAKQLYEKDDTKSNGSGELMDNSATSTKENCDYFKNSKEFKSIFFKSLKDGRKKEILTNKNDELGSGGFGKVYVAFAQNGKADGIPEKQCLAVKEIRLGSGSESISNKGFRNSIKVIKMIEKLDEPKRRHLLKIYDYGLIESSTKRRRSKRALIIMEKGTEGFDERLYNDENPISDNDKDKSEQQLLQMTRQLVVPIEEMHQVAMHLDVKPHNFLYVPTVDVESGESEELLKLIDFDGAEPIPGKIRWGLWRKRLAHYKRADYRRVPKNPLYSPLYSSPESYRRKCSSKADMWSMGVIIFELIFVRMVKKEFPDANEETLRLAISKKIFDIVPVYSGKSTDLKAKWPKPKRFVYNLRWLISSVKEVKSILRIWFNFPRLAVLITNLLDVMPQRRMTAAGVLEYLAGKCYPAELFRTDYARAGTIFNKISLNKLSEMISAQKRQCDSEKCTQKWVKMDKMVAKVAEIRQDGIVNKSQEMLDNGDIKECATRHGEGGKKGKVISHSLISQNKTKTRSAKFKH